MKKLSDKALETMARNDISIEIVEYGDDKGRLWVRPRSENGYGGYDFVAECKAGKHPELEEIRAYLIDRQDRINAIPGLKELDKAIAHDDYMHMLGWLNDNPDTDPQVLSERYPRAAAYLKALSWSRSGCADKASAGKAALDAIIYGEDYAEAISAMEQAWTGPDDSFRWE